MEEKYQGILLIFENGLDKEQCRKFCDFFRIVKQVSEAEPQKDSSIESKAMALARREVVNKIYDMLIFVE